MSNLSPHFTLGEMTRSGTATRLGLDNTPTPLIVSNLQQLCINVLEPVRAHFGKPISISSGYRSPEVNRAQGGAANSQHLFGEAADFEIMGVRNMEVVQWIHEHLKFDQLIAEVLKANDPNAGWIHCSWKAGANRNQTLSFLGKNNGGYVPGMRFA